MADLETPGCFGFVVCYEKDSEFCAGCAFEAKCAELVEARKSTLTGLLGGRGKGVLEGSLKSSPRAHTETLKVADKDDTNEQEDSVEKKRGGSAPKNYGPGEMSKKAQALDASLKRLGVDAPGMLKAGKNPLAGAERLTFFRMACEQLLADKALDRDKLRQSYMDKLGWDIKTANSHLSIIASYLSAYEIVALDGKTYLRVVL